MSLFRVRSLVPAVTTQVARLSSSTTAAVVSAAKNVAAEATEAPKAQHLVLTHLREANAPLSRAELWARVEAQNVLASRMHLKRVLDELKRSRRVGARPDPRQAEKMAAELAQAEAAGQRHFRPRRPGFVYYVTHLGVDKSAAKAPASNATA